MEPCCPLCSPPQTTMQSDSESSSLQSNPASKPVADASKAPPPPSTTAAPQFGQDRAPIQSDRSCLEESDEEMEVLLEDIMMSLNILPSEERSCRSPALPQASQNRAQVVCSTQVPEERSSRRGAHAAAGDGGGLVVYHQGCRTHVSLCSTDTGTCGWGVLQHVMY